MFVAVTVLAKQLADCMRITVMAELPAKRVKVDPDALVSGSRVVGHDADADGAENSVVEDDSR